MTSRESPDIFRVTPSRAPTRLGRLDRLRADADVLGVIALGGGLGSLGRYGVAQWFPTRSGHFPWSTFIVNAAGCMLIGVLVVLVSDVWPSGRYTRPFLGVGVLGGFTTYSTAMLDLRTLLADADWLTADAYLLGSLAAGLIGVWLGVVGTRVVTRTAVRLRRRGTRHEEGR